MDNSTQHYAIAEVIESVPIIVLTSISVLATVWTSVTILAFDKMRNLPGIIILNIAVTTCTLQLVFLVGERHFVRESHPNACVAVAIVLHYLVLVSSFWVDIMALDIYLQLSRWSASPRSSAKLVPRYAACAYGFPLVIVSIAVGINFCDCSGGFRVGYGEAICFMTGRMANAIFLILPIVFSLFFGGFLFFRSAAIIRRALAVQDSNNNLDKQKAFKQIRICGRKRTIIGTFYLLCIISAFWMEGTSTFSLVLSWIFAILLSTQGLGSCVCYICNRRVWKLYRDSWNKLWKRTPRETTTVTVMLPLSSSPDAVFVDAVKTWPNSEVG